jgi:hypothetical protein
MPLSHATRKNIFNKLKTALKKQSPPMVISKNTADTYEIMGNKPVPYGIKKTIVPGMYFSSTVARKDMVSFYLFPVYYHGKEFFDIAPTAMKCLKGKTCFNFKKEEQVIDKELDALLNRGAQIWKKLGYMK